MYNIFYKLSGKPKSGDILKSISPVLFTFQVLACIWGLHKGVLLYKANPVYSLFISFAVVVISWQIGWIMSNKRFYNSEKSINRDLDKTKSRVVEGIRPFIFISENLVSLLLIQNAFSYYENVFLCSISMIIIGVFISWQTGWGMNFQRIYYK